MPLWVDAAEVSGAVSATLAFVGGVGISMYYGRKSNATISGDIHPLGDGTAVLTARPSVSAVGVFRLKFDGDMGANVRVTELYRDPGGGIVDGREWVKQAVFGTSFVEAGETLVTTVLFPVGNLELAELVGWRASFGIRVVRWPRARGRVWAWADKIYVPKPSLVPAKSEAP